MSGSPKAELVIAPDGSVQGLYSDEIDLVAISRQLGDVTVARASHVEPTDDCQFTADMALSGGPVLGPVARRPEALKLERSWLREHRLGIDP